MKTPQEIGQFLCALVKHWAALLTGGAIIAFNTAYHAERQTQQGKSEFNILAFLFFVMAAFLAWRDQYRIARNLEVTHVEQLTILKAQIQTLQTQLDERSRRQKIKDALGEWHITMQNLSAELMGMGFNEYDGDRRQKFEVNIIQLEEAILSFFEKMMGKSEAALFMDVSQVPGVPYPKMEDAFTKMLVARKAAQNRLEFRTKQLGLAMVKLDSRDFVLPPQS